MIMDSRAFIWLLSHLPELLLHSSGLTALKLVRLATYLELQRMGV